MPTPFPILVALLLAALFTAACAIPAGMPLATGDNGTRIVFGEEETRVEQAGFFLAPGETDEFLIAAAGATGFTFQFTPRGDSPIAYEMRTPTGEVGMAGHGRSLAWHSTPTTRGDFRVRLTHEGTEEVDYAITITRTLPTDEQEALKELLETFAGVGVSVEHEPSVQRTTIFDELYGQEVATLEILSIDRAHQRVDVYIFADEGLAREAAAAIEPGASYLTRRDGANQITVPLGIGAGSLPLWWQHGRFLLYTTGPDPDLEQTISQVLGDPLGATLHRSLKVRLGNRTGSALTNVRLSAAGEEVVLAQLPPGTSGYHLLPAGEEIALAVEQQSSLLQSEIAALPSGHYTVDVLVSEQQLFARAFNDRDFYIPADLIGVNWVWQYTDLTGGARFEPVSSGLEPPFVRFSRDSADNMGEAGLLYGGNMGCNAVGGTYLANAEGELLLSRGASEQEDCGGPSMESEQFWFEHAPLIDRYEVEGEMMRLFVNTGDTFVFTREGEIPVESRIYRSILSEWGGDAPFLVVAESAAGKADATEEEIRATLVALFGDGPGDALALQPETVYDFLQRNAAPVALPEVADLGAELVFVTRDEVDVFFSGGDEAGWEAVADRFDGAQTIFTFSLPGLNESEGQALVYYGVRYPGFEGGYYALKISSVEHWPAGGMSSLAWSNEPE